MASTLPGSEASGGHTHRFSNKENEELLALRGGARACRRLLQNRGRLWVCHYLPGAVEPTKVQLFRQLLAWRGFASSYSSESDP
jgi:hypothetical protein